MHFILSIKSIVISVILFVELMAGMLQFHSHDCMGHAKFASIALNCAIGCSHHHDHIHVHNHQSSDSFPDEESDSCGMHLDKYEASVFDWSHSCPDICNFAILPLFAQFNDGSETVDYTRSNDFGMKYSILSEFIRTVEPKRGSPAAANTLC